MILVDLAIALIIFAGAALVTLAAILLLKEVARKPDDSEKQ